MKFTVATNFQDDFIPHIKKDSVVELYGKLTSDFIGGGRASYLLPNITKKNVEKHVREAHKYGLKFNYLLNAACLDNKEFTIKWQNRFNCLLRWLESIEVDYLTVTNPYMLQIIKRRFDRFKLCVSIFAFINSVEEARFWEELGADRITLSLYSVRDFRLLKAIRKAVKCELLLIANNACLYNCPMARYHTLITSHASQAYHSSNGYVIDYCSISCRYRRILNPLDFIRSGWIRPEDVGIYEDIGINMLKLVDRSCDSEMMSNIVNAYDKRQFDGNLLELFPNLWNWERIKKYGMFHKVKYFFHPFCVNLFKLWKLTKSQKEPYKYVYIDNKALDDFVEGFFDRDCRTLSCQDCGYCRKFAERAVKVSPEYRDKIIPQYKEMLDGIISGSIFRY